MSKPVLRRYNEETQRLIEKQRDVNRAYQTFMAEGARKEERQQTWEKLHQAKGETRDVWGEEAKINEKWEVKDIGTRRPN